MKKIRITKYSVVSFASLAIFFFLWWLITDGLRLTEAHLLPGPGTVVKAFFTKLTNPNPDGGILTEHILASLQVTLTGFALGVGIGIPLGVLMAWFPLFDKFFRPIFDLIRPIPTIAWIPIMILWFGIGLLPKVILIAIATFVPSVLNAYAGINLTNPVHLWVAQTFGANRSELLFRVAIPTALPSFFSALRVALNVAWMSLVAAELLAATKGLGYMIQLNRMLGRVENIIVGMLVIGALGAFFSYLLEVVERRFVKGGTRFGD